MSTPPPDPSGSASTVAALHQITLQLQALLHQQQVYGNLPSSSAQAMAARQSLGQATSVFGAQTSAPVAPTGAWLRQAAQSLMSQVANQPRSSGGSSTPPPAPTPPATPQGGLTVTGQPGMPPMGMWQAPWSPGAMGMYYPATGSTPVVAPSQAGSGGGGGGGGGMGGWVRRSLPTIGGAIGGPVGAAVGQVLALSTQAPAEVRSQRDKNAYYQSIEGGSNFGGFGERLHEEAYRWSTFGVLSSDEARRAFKGVTKLGYNSKVEGGPGRQDALNFVYHGKTSYGASVDESLQELQVNSKNALGNLKDLSKALKDVSDSAGKAGINAQMARGEFTQLMDQAIKNGFGSSSTDVAQLEQQTKNSYGRSFEGVDVSGRLTQAHAVMAASLSGISLAQYMTGGATVKAGADQKLDTATVSAILKPGVEAWIKQQIATAGGNVDEGVVQQIAEEMLRQFYPDDLQALGPVVASISGNSGLANDPVKAAMWVVQQFNGKGAQTTAAQMSKTDAASQAKQHAANRVQSGTSLMQHNRGAILRSDFGTQSTAATKAYQSWADSTGNQDLVVRNLLRDVDDDKTQVAVTTKSGKRVVSLADAIKNHRDELASGKAVIVSGNQAGKSVKDIVGANNVDPLRNYSKEAAATDNSGQSYADWAKTHSSKNGTLQISLTPDARRLLTVLDTTGVDGSAATASPPTSPYAQNPSYGG